MYDTFVLEGLKGIQCYCILLCCVMEKKVVPTVKGVMTSYKLQACLTSCKSLLVLSNTVMQNTLNMVILFTYCTLLSHYFYNQQYPFIYIIITNCMMEILTNYIQNRFYKRAKGKALYSLSKLYVQGTLKLLHIECMVTSDAPMIGQILDISLIGSKVKLLVSVKIQHRFQMLS